MNKVDLLNALRGSIMDVEFTKKDGTTRKMKATLNESWIPVDKRPKGTGKELPAESPIIRAFDTELSEFRSINTETITSVQVA